MKGAQVVRVSTVPFFRGVVSFLVHAVVSVKIADLRASTGDKRERRGVALPLVHGKRREPLPN